MMELTDIDINEDNLDFSQVKSVSDLFKGEEHYSDFQRNVDCQQDHPVPQVCQIAARFQDEGDERQVEFSNSNFLSSLVNLSLSFLFRLTRFKNYADYPTIFGLRCWKS